MVVACPLCGSGLSELPSARSEPVLRTCPGCGTLLVLRQVDAVGGEGDAATVFQPRVLVEAAEDPGAATLAALPGESAAGAAAGAPRLPPGVEPYFLVLGAPPGRERIRLEQARTVFGRGGEADVELRDEQVAERHFQVEVMGREYYLRDLGSGRGTRLNGREVRYTELLPGDEVSAGEISLVFRTADDGLSRRGG